MKHKFAFHHSFAVSQVCLLHSLVWDDFKIIALAIVQCALGMSSLNIIVFATRDMLHRPPQPIVHYCVYLSMKNPDKSPELVEALERLGCKMMINNK
jgi:hypothetical protein